MPGIYIVTGIRDGGKTLFLKELSSLLIASGIQLSGFLSEGELLPGGQKDFVLKSLTSGKTIPLASRNHEQGWFFAVSFWFNPEAVKAGNEIIQNAIEYEYPVLILDEIGPVEMEDMVWHEGLISALKNYHGLLIFSVRERLIDAIIGKYQPAEFTIVNILNTSPLELRNQILSGLSVA